MIGKLAPGAVALGLLAVGAGAIVAPLPSSGQYGIEVVGHDSASYVRAVGLRDLVIGAMILQFLARRENAAVVTTLCLSSAIAFGDFAIVLRARGAVPNLAIHATGAIGILVAWTLARREL